jgi:mono/diheme cytochrome c family protein
MTITGFLWLALAGADSFAADTRHGQQLLSAHCGECHDTSIYSAAGRKAKDLDTIKQQTESGALALGLQWSSNDVADVAAYLNEQFYRYAK